MKDMDRGPWILTKSGGAFYLDDPRPGDFNLEDMAAGISKDCRFGGQLKAEYDDEIYSVAQHSVYVDILVGLMGRPDARPWAILHDAVEGLYGDMTSPQKSITSQYAEREDRAQAALIQQFGIPYNDDIAAVVHAADKQLSAMEADVMTSVPARLWTSPIETLVSLEELDPLFYCWRPKEASKRFLNAVYAQLNTL